MLFLLLLLFLVTAPILATLFFELKNSRLKRLVNRFPGPAGLPLLGNAHQAGSTPTEILAKEFRWWMDFGQKNFRIWIGNHPYIYLTETKDVEFLLTSNNFIRKSEVYDMLHPWLGQGLLTSTGVKWFKHRKMITPSFHFKILQNFYDVMNTHSTKFIKKLETASAGETIFDFQAMVHYFTLDVICDTAMGVSVNAMDSPDAQLVKAFKDMCYSINMRAFHPFKRNNFLFKLFPDYRKYRKTLKILQDFTYDVIKKRIAVRAENRTEDITNGDEDEDGDGDEAFSRRKVAFLDTLLTSTIDGRPLTLQEIYEEVSTFIFEGHDTSTSGVAFAIYLLSRHKEVQAKVYAEQVKILGSMIQRDATFQVQEVHMIMCRLVRAQETALIKTIVSKIVRTFEILPPLDELWSTDGYVENFIGLSPEEIKLRRPNPSKYDPVLSAILTLKSENGISIRLRKRY